MNYGAVPLWKMSKDIPLLLRQIKRPQEYSLRSENLSYNAIITTCLYKTLRWEMYLLYPRIHMCMQRYMYTSMYLNG